MIQFFSKGGEIVYAAGFRGVPEKKNLDKMAWLFNKTSVCDLQEIVGTFIGPRKEMVSPWSTNAVEICQNMGIQSIYRVEEYKAKNEESVFDPMLQTVYELLDQSIFTPDNKKEGIRYIENIKEYSDVEGLALSDDEIEYLKNLSQKLGRQLTDSEIFGFSQVNSEHCRHKIFNGEFILNGEKKGASLFELIKRTTRQNPNRVVSAYKDNVAFIKGPKAELFAPERGDRPSYFKKGSIVSAISIKAETHNFPTTVEPFYGASTGSGGEIRDRMAGGKGSFPLAGSAVYMTPYSRNGEKRVWEKKVKARKWLYQTPENLLVKASNGASDFGNKFGQPLISGSVLTFEHEEKGEFYGYDKVIMLAGGIGSALLKDTKKAKATKGNKVVLLGGDNYRIGMGGSSVSSVNTGQYESMIELNAVQRANPEMQKRAYNAIRALAESTENPIISIHDHGAGGHLNCLSEFLEDTGGVIDIDKLPIGDETMSLREIIGNESQERMGLLLKEDDIELLRNIAERERAPMYVVGEATSDMVLKFDSKEGTPFNLSIKDLFGNPPKTVVNDSRVDKNFAPVEYDVSKFLEYSEKVVQLEAVGCKDWLTNKVDRSVTGRVAMQQAAGELQLPLNNLGIMATDYRGRYGIATTIGHAPVAGLINPEAGSLLSIAEALTNIVWAPILGGLKGVSLSANWMWPCKNPGEDERLYRAVEAVSNFACELGINVPTGKDSLSMTQKYPDGKKVTAPGTVIISAVGQVSNIKKAVSPVAKSINGSLIYYIDFSCCGFELGGTSFAQTLGFLGNSTASVKSADYFKSCFEAVQKLVNSEVILAGHDVGSGGLITTLAEMLFSNPLVGFKITFSPFEEEDIVKIAMSEKPSVVIQIEEKNKVCVEEILNSFGVVFHQIGVVNSDRVFTIQNNKESYSISVDNLRDTWYRPSFLLDSKQCSNEKAVERFENYAKQPLDIKFRDYFKGSFRQYSINARRVEPTGIKAAIIREKGINGDREMAYSLYLAGFDVKDVHITDLISGREDLSEVNFIVFTGGFSNSDVLGSAKGWAGAFLYNEKAKEALDNFYAREDTLSLGVCNGCQLMVELGLIYKDHEKQPVMLHNDSHKFESAFLSVDIPANNSVMLSSLMGSKLGIWVAHGEGKFYLPYEEDRYNIPMKYSYKKYPGNPNGSIYNSAAICSKDGRHLAMMPHIERAVLPWQWAFYPVDRKQDQVSPWIEGFVNAREWIADKTSKR